MSGTKKLKIKRNPDGRYYTLEDLNEEARLDAREKEALIKKGMRKDDTNINARVKRVEWERFKLLVSLGWIKNIRTGLDEAIRMYVDYIELEKRKERYVDPAYAAKLGGAGEKVVAAKDEIAVVDRDETATEDKPENGDPIIEEGW